MKYAPRQYQIDGAESILAYLHNPGPKKTAGFVAPTGSGKGSTIALCLEQEAALWVTAPNGLICAGILEMLTGESKYDAKERDWEAARIFTTGRAVNLLAAGRIPPKFLLHDEGAHGTADTYSSVWDLCGRCPRALLTATPYRGTPDETEKLRLLADSWEHIITLEECVNAGYVTLPEFSTIPLLDDDLVDISNGEFSVKSTDSLVRSRLDAILEMLEGFFKDGLWDDTCTLVLPGVSSINLLLDAMTSRGLPAVAIVADTSDAARLAAFRQSMAKTHCLLQIRAVGEGVDFPFRIMWDLSPTTSPMLWFQRVGRTTRPGGRSRYFACCHNALRHMYLFGGLIPTGVAKQAREVWGKEWKPSRRLMTRALGEMGFGRFKPIEVPTASGSPVFLYSLKSAMESYACLLLPTQPDPVFFVRSDLPTGEIAAANFGGRTVQYAKKSRGKWRCVPRLPDVANAASLPPERITDKVLFDYATHAARHGLDPKHIPDAKQASLFHILRDTGLAVG